MDLWGTLSASSDEEAFLISHGLLVETYIPADSLGKIWVFNLSRYRENTSRLVHNDDVLILEHNFDVLEEASKR